MGDKEVSSMDAEIRGSEMNRLELKITDEQMDKVCDLWDAEASCFLCGEAQLNTDGFRTKAFFAQVGGPRATFQGVLSFISVCPACFKAMASVLEERKLLRKGMPK
jgi:hypothetical protein